jgi:hypothetical protein
MSWEGDEYGPRPECMIARVPEEILRVHARNVAHVICLARAAGCEVCLSTSAHMLEPGMGGQHLKRLRRGFGWFHHLNPSGVLAALDELNEGLRRLSAKEHTLFVDLDRLMPKSFDLFVDVCHMREPGLRLMAEHLCRAIVDSGIVERQLNRS